VNVLIKILIALDSIDQCTTTVLLVLHQTLLIL